IPTRPSPAARIPTPAHASFSTLPRPPSCRSHRTNAPGGVRVAPHDTQQKGSAGGRGAIAGPPVRSPRYSFGCPSGRLSASLRNWTVLQILRVTRLRERVLVRDRVLAGRAVAPEDLLEVLDVHVAVLEGRLQVEPRVVEERPEGPTVVRGLELVVSDVHHAVGVHVAFEEPDGDGDIRAVNDLTARSDTRKRDLAAESVGLARAERVAPDVSELTTLVEQRADSTVVVARRDPEEQVGLRRDRDGRDDAVRLVARRDDRVAVAVNRVLADAAEPDVVLRQDRRRAAADARSARNAARVVQPVRRLDGDVED